jgi:hypothetical protein
MTVLSTEVYKGLVIAECGALFCSGWNVYKDTGTLDDTGDAVYKKQNESMSFFDSVEATKRWIDKECS